MDINITLLGEILTFTCLLVVMIKYIWPHLTRAIDERQRQIAEGIESGKQGKRELASVHHEIELQLAQAKEQVARIFEQTRLKSNTLLEDSRMEATLERERILVQAEEEVKQKLSLLKTSLQQHTAELVIVALEKIIQQDVNPEFKEQLIERLLREI